MRVLSSVSLALVIAASGCGTGGNGDDCTPNARTVCKDGVVYWVDSCGNQGDKAGDCDCGCNADFTACKTPCDCVTSCGGKECGPNGCGGTCAPGCDAGETCNEVTGLCEGGCVPSCTGKCCGDDGCDSTLTCQFVKESCEKKFK